MQRLLVPSLLALGVLLSGAPTRADVQWTQTLRLVGSEAIVTNATEFASVTDSETSDLIGPFLAFASVDTMVTGVSGTSFSEQDSDLFATGFTGSGGFGTTTDVDDPAGFADVFGRSVFTGYFDLDASTPYALTGLLTSGAPGATAQVILHGPGGPVVNVQATPGLTMPVDAAGTLPPGSYLVTVSVAGNAQEAPPNLATEASGEWTLEFVLGGATAAPITGPALGLRVFPNPTRGSATISLASRSEAPKRIRIHDAAGRLVRSMDDATGNVTWDTRDVAGRIVPAGVYFVTVRTGGRIGTERLIVLR
jgi:hypothetical protein